MNILFDLDGTLTDPGEGITNSAAYALEKFGIKIEDKRELYCLIGPPLYDGVIKFFGFSAEEAKVAVKYYRDYYGEYGIFQNELYVGIPELLQMLKKHNHKVMLATSKPKVFAEKILRYFDIYKYFDFVAGASLDKPTERKADIIKYALENGDTDCESIMVGDRMYDIYGAKENHKNL